MKKAKKTLAIFLALAMTVSLTACGGASENNSSTSKTDGSTESSSTADSSQEDTPEEVKTVTMWIPSMYDMPLGPQVQDAMNAISEEKYGIHYELSFVNWGNYEQQINLALTDDELDIFTPSNIFDYYKNGQLADITEYYEAASDEVKSAWGDRYINTMWIDGSLYGVPHIADYGHYVSLNLDQEVADKYGITQDQEISMQEVDELLVKIHEDFPERYTLGAGGGTYLFANAFYTWDPMDDTVGVLADKGQSTTVESVFDNEDYIYLAELAEKWYKAGYIMPDILSNTQAWASMIANNQIAAVFDTYGVNYVDGVVRTRISEVGCWTPSASFGASSWCVSANSKDPEAAFTALALLFSDKDLATYLNNGIEGENYTKNDDGTISYINGTDAGSSGYGAPSVYWKYPGAQLSQPLDVNGADFFERLETFNDECQFSKAVGFYFDREPVIDEMSACQAVIDKYYTTLLSGAVDVESTLEQARTEMEAAGEDIVIAEKQKQLDEYLANK